MQNQNLNQNQKPLFIEAPKKPVAESTIGGNALLAVFIASLLFLVIGPAMTAKAPAANSQPAPVQVEQVTAPTIQSAPVLEEVEQPAPKVKSINVAPARESKKKANQDEVKQAVEEFKARNTVQPLAADVVETPAPVLKPTEDLQGGGFVGSLDELKNPKVENTKSAPDMQTLCDGVVVQADFVCGVHPTTPDVRVDSSNSQKEAIGGSRTPDINLTK